MTSSECIIAPGWLIGHMGYKAVWRNGREVLAHRWAWEQEHGPIPEGMLVLHHCDNPPCWNVEHLYLGTHHDNAVDRSTRGRHAQQQKTHCPKGHPYDLKSSGRRRCTVCLAGASARYWKRRGKKRRQERKHG